MINILYKDGIRVEIKDIGKVTDVSQLPLRIDFKNSISKKIVWSTNLSDNMWASYPNNEMIDVLITDSKGNFIYQYLWDVMIDGSIFYKSLWLYCKSLINCGYNPNGLVIGTHDGDFGEWCPLVRNYLSDMILVEGSKPQYDDLIENYKDKKNLIFLNEIVTTDGLDVEFFEGGKGYTNTTIERVIRGWETEEIKSSIRKSVSINNIIEEYVISKGKKLDWIHMDVEGLDAKLLMSIKDEYLPKFVIFEDYNLSNEDKDMITEWINKQSYNRYSKDGISMITK